MQPSADNVVEFGTVEEAVALLDEWIAAYRELEREHMRLQWRCAVLQEDLGNARAAIDNDLFLADLEEARRF